jgi:3-hydroxybutyryl-CoA dehydrogenase
MKNSTNQTQTISIGIVGLGLMGCSITTCMLMAGHTVVAIAPIPDDLQTALPRISQHLEKAYHQELLDKEANVYLSNLTH